MGEVEGGGRLGGVERRECGSGSGAGQSRPSPVRPSPRAVPHHPPRPFLRPVPRPAPPLSPAPPLPPAGCTSSAGSAPPPWPVAPCLTSRCVPPPAAACWRPQRWRVRGERGGGGGEGGRRVREGGDIRGNQDNPADAMRRTPHTPTRRQPSVNSPPPPRPTSPVSHWAPALHHGVVSLRLPWTATHSPALYTLSHSLPFPLTHFLGLGRSIPHPPFAMLLCTNPCNPPPPPRAGKVLPALEALLTEVARVRLHGFSEGEVRRAVAELVAEVENTALEVRRRGGGQAGEEGGLGGVCACVCVGVCMGELVAEVDTNTHARTHAYMLCSAHL